MEDIVRNEILVLTSSWEVKEGRKSSDGSLLILLSFDLLQRDSLLTAQASLVLCIWNKKEVLRQEKGKKLPYQQKENQWRKVYEAKNFVQEDKNKGRKAAYPETSCLFFSLPFFFFFSWVFFFSVNIEFFSPLPLYDVLLLFLRLWRRRD